MHETHLAFAPEGTRVVQALAILAEGGIVRAFVYIQAVVTVSFEAGVALAPEGAVIVYALSVLIATTVVGQTLVYVTATDPITSKSVLTATLVRSL